MLDAMGEAARAHIDAARRVAPAALDAGTCVQALNTLSRSTSCGFVGNRKQYEDPRNSCLNEVLERRTGIPITMSVVYMEVARRAGLRIDGVNFPGHFLVRCCEGKPRTGAGLIIDPFHGGALLTEHDCRMLLQRHVGDEVAFSKSLLAPATRPQVISRDAAEPEAHLRAHALVPAGARRHRDAAGAHAVVARASCATAACWRITSTTSPSALRDLQAYLKLSSMSELDDDTREEQEQIWEHVKTLRRRVAAMQLVACCSP